MFRPRTLSLLMLGTLVLAALAGTGCGGVVGRGTPAPGATPTIARTAGPTAPAASPVPTPTRTPSPSPALATLTPRSVLPTATPKPPPVTDPAATASTGLTLEIFGIGEETVIKGSSIVVAGRTSPDAVLSINGVIIPLDDDGRFEITVALNMGPNLIEVVASDLDGDQKSRILAVIALPEA